MKTQIRIIRDFKLLENSISIEYRPPNRNPKTIYSIKDFNNSLLLYPLDTIDKIYIYGEIKDICKIHFWISPGDTPNEWKVERDKEFFFSFPYNGEDGFIDVFWGELKKRFDPPDRPGPEAKFM